MGQSLALAASHFKDACGVGACIHYGCRWLFRGCDLLRLFRHLIVNPHVERQEEPHHELNPLLKGFAHLAVGGCQVHPLTNFAIESFSAF